MHDTASIRKPKDSDEILRRIEDVRLRKVGENYFSGKRLNFTDGLTCLETTDLLGLGSLALADKIARYGDQVCYVVNQHINYTNICVNGCKFCAFYRKPGTDGGYVLNKDDVVAKIRSSSAIGLKEVHIVGAVNPDLSFDYYMDLLNAIRTSFPEIKIKAFTAVEISQIAAQASLNWRDCLIELQKAGLDALPGGGAEIFSDRIRKELFAAKIGADDWLSIHGEAHKLGIGTNATMLFGHIETLSERVEHLFSLEPSRTRQEDLGL